MNFSFDNQGIEVVSTVFSIQNGKIVIYLAPSDKGMYTLPYGEIYNNESCEKGLERILNNNYNLHKLSYQEQFHTFSSPYRSALKRLIAVGYIVISMDENINNWYSLEDLPPLAYDHKNILIKALDYLKGELMKSNIASLFLPNKFTLPQLQSVYETILQSKLDRRNFRRKFLSLGIIRYTGEKEEVSGHRPGLYYEFIHEGYKELEVFSFIKR